MPSNPYKVTLTGLSSSSGYTFYAPDTTIRPFAIGIGVVATSSTQIYSVQHTFDYTGSSTFISSNATWFNNSGINGNSSNAATGSNNYDGNYAFPVTAIRLNVTAGASTATTTLNLIQAG